MYVIGSVGTIEADLRSLFLGNEGTGSHRDEADTNPGENDVSDRRHLMTMAPRCRGEKQNSRDTYGASTGPQKDSNLFEGT